MTDPIDMVEAAERVASLLRNQGVGTVLIGAAAMAAHGYVRFTEDIGLGVELEVHALRSLAAALRSEGFAVQLREPDDDDPLGGVIDISGPFGLVQIVSFANRFPAAIRDALAEESIPITEGGLLAIPLPQLVALKLYAGGTRSHADIVELLRRNPDADLDLIRETCRRYRLKGLDHLLEEL